MTDFDTKTPRVDAITHEVSQRYRGDNDSRSKAIFYEQELVPLARQLEIELNQANEKIAELQKAHKRYEKVRRLTPSAFSDLWNENLHTGTAFDVLVDGLR